MMQFRSISHFLSPISHFPFPTSHFAVPISHFLCHLSHFPFPISHFPFPISYFPCPLPMARPGGMRGAIESPALAVWQELACRIQSRSPHLRSHLADLRPPQNLPQRPRAFRQATSNGASDRFCDFQKTVASAERGAKNLC